MDRKLLALFIAIVGVIVCGGIVHAQDAMQTQMSSDGNIKASLFEAKVRRNVLTVKVTLENISGARVDPMIIYRDVYYTDIEKEKKYFVLKDAEGKYISGPKYDGNDGGRFWYDIEPGGKKIFWVKFPAPPESTKVVDIFIPGVLPFEEIEIKR